MLIVYVCVWKLQLHGEMTNGNDVTQNTKHTNLFNKKHLLHTLFLQPTRQQVFNYIPAIFCPFQVHAKICIVGFYWNSLKCVAKGFFGPGTILRRIMYCRESRVKKPLKLVLLCPTKVHSFFNSALFIKVCTILKLSF